MMCLINSVTIQLSLNGTNESGIGIPLSFEASISCKKAFSQAKTLFLRPEIDRGSGMAAPRTGRAGPADY